MFREIGVICDEFGFEVFDNSYDMLYTILGRPHVDLSENHMEKIWLVILKSVSVMYKKNMKYKRGIG